MATISACNNHPSVKSEARCRQCGKPVCKQCLFADAFCGSDCHAKNLKFATGFKKPGDTSRSSLPGILFFVAVVAGLAYGAKSMGYLDKFLKPPAPPPAATPPPEEK